MEGEGAGGLALGRRSVLRRLELLERNGEGNVGEGRRLGVFLEVAIAQTVQQLPFGFPNAEIKRNMVDQHIAYKTNPADHGNVRPIKANKEVQCHQSACNEVELIEGDPTLSWKNTYLSLEETLDSVTDKCRESKKDSPPPYKR